MTQRVVVVGAIGQIALGYQFSFPDLDSAPRDLLGQPDGARAAR